MISRETQTAEDQAARTIIERCGISLLDAALLIQQLFRRLPGHGKKIIRAEKCIESGKRAYERQTRTVTFEAAVEAALRTKRHRRPRTVAEIKYFCHRLMKRCEGLSKRSVRTIQPEECQRWIHQSFHTDRQRYKARLIMSGVFSVACKRGWRTDNPASSRVLDISPPREKEIRVLSLQEIEELKISASRHHTGACCAALGFMLYAGIRPAEIVRLTWDMIDLEDNVINLPSRHTKTGGARQVSIRPVLKRWLQETSLLQVECPPQPGQPICPKNWKAKWRHVRHQAGWGIEARPWIQDVLRHTFASYHIKHFRDLSELQLEMGHSRPDLLQTRYLNLSGLSAQVASIFWGSPTPFYQ